MSQADLNIIPTVHNGVDLSEFLNEFRAALNSMHSGTNRPPYATAGIMWLDTVSPTEWNIYQFDGKKDIFLWRINPVDGTLIFPTTGGVTTFNGRAGAVVLTNTDVQVLENTWTKQQTFTGNIFSQSYNFAPTEAIYWADGKLQFAIKGDPVMDISGTGEFRVKGAAFKPGGGVWADLSDERIKTDVSPLDGSLAKLMELRPVKYELLTEAKGELTAGFIAQEARTVFPNAVSETEPGDKEHEFIPAGEKILAIGWKNDFFAYLVGAIQELKAEVDALKAAK